MELSSPRRSLPALGDAHQLGDGAFAEQQVAQHAQPRAVGEAQDVHGSREPRGFLNVVRSRFVVAFVVFVGARLRRRRAATPRGTFVCPPRRGRTRTRKRPPRFFFAPGTSTLKTLNQAHRETPSRTRKHERRPADVPRNGDRSASATRDSRLDFGTPRDFSTRSSSSCHGFHGLCHTRLERRLSRTSPRVEPTGSRA